MTSAEVNLLRGYIRRPLRSCNAEIPGVEPPDEVTIYLPTTRYPIIKINLDMWEHAGAFRVIVRTSNNLSSYTTTLSTHQPHFTWSGNLLEQTVELHTGRGGNELLSGGKWKWRWTGTTRKTLSWYTTKYGASTVTIVSDQNVIVSRMWWTS